MSTTCSRPDCCWVQAFTSVSVFFSNFKTYGCDNCPIFGSDQARGCRDLGGQGQFACPSAC